MRQLKPSEIQRNRDRAWGPTPSDMSTESGGGIAAPRPESFTPADALPKVQPLTPTLQKTSYWNNPINVAMTYHRMQEAPGNTDWGALGIQSELVETAYKRLQEVNGTGEFWKWQPLDQADPFSMLLSEAAAPAPEAQWNIPQGFSWGDVFGDLAPPDELLPTSTPATPTAPASPAGPPTPSPEIWASLPSWQKTTYAITSSSFLSSVANMAPWIIGGALVGAATGGIGAGIIGALIPTVGAAAMGGLSDPQTWDKLRNQYGEQGWIDALQSTATGVLGILNKPAEWLEQGLGTYAQLSDVWLSYSNDVIAAGLAGNMAELKAAKLARWDAFTKMLDSLPEAWEASKLTYESVSPNLGMNIPAGIEWLVDNVFRGETDVTFAGKDQVWKLTEDGYQAVTVDAIGIAALNLARSEILQGKPPEQVIEKYRETFGLSGQMVDLMFQSFADPLNIVPLVETKAIGLLADQTGNVTLRTAAKIAGSHGEGAVGLRRIYGEMLGMGEAWKTVDGQMVRVLPSEYTPRQIRLSGLVKTETGDFVRRDLSATQRAGMAIGRWSENPFNPLGFVQEWNRLSPKSRLAEVQKMAWENAMAISDLAAGDPEKIGQLFDSWANLKPHEARAEAELLNMPEAATVRQFLADFAATRLNEARALWQSGDPKRRTLHDLSAALGEEWTETLKTIKSDDVKALDVLRQRLSERGLDGKFTLPALRDMVKQFKAAPWTAHPEYYAAHLRNLLLDHVTDAGIKAFGIKPDKSIVRFSHALKTIQSMVLLNLNPAYLVNNVINNTVTRIYDGMFGLKKPSTIVAEFRELGILPYRLESGVGIGDVDLGNIKALEVEIDAARKKVREAMRKGDWIDHVGDLASGIASKLSGVQKLSAKMEAFEGMQAFSSSFDRTYPHLARAMLPQLPPRLARELGSEGAARLIAAAVAGRSAKDLNRALAGEVRAAHAVDLAARDLGIDPARASETLNASGALPELERRLAAGEPLESALLRVEETIQDYLDGRAAEAITTEMQYVRDRITTEGLAAAIDVLFDVFSTTEEFWTRHISDWGRTWQVANAIGVTGETRRSLIEGRDAIQQKEWERHNRRVEATYAAALRGMGLSDPDVREVTIKLDQMHTGWRKFFQERRKLFSELRRKKYKSDAEFQGGFSAVQEKLQEMYRAHSEQEQAITAELSRIFGEKMERQFGQGQAGREYFTALATAQQLRQQVMSDYRAWLAGGEPQNPQVRALVDGWTPDRRHDVWPQFYEKVYLPVIGRYIQAGFDGVMRLHEALTGEPATPRRTGMQPPEAGPEPVVPPVEPSPTSPPAAQTAEQVVTTARQAGMNPQVMAAQVALAFPDYSPEQIGVVMRIVRARADTWARETGRPASEWYREHIAEVRPGEVEDLPTAAQAGAIEGAPPRAAVTFLEDGRAIITAMRKADISTLVHEVGHIFRRDLAGADAETAAAWAGATKVESGWEWSRAAEEKFANGFVRYLEDGRAPTSRLRQVFEKFKVWLTDLYRSVRGPDVEITPEVRGVFDRLIAERAEGAVRGFEGRGSTLANVGEGLKRLGWERGKKGLLNAVNKDRREAGLDPYAKFEDVPWDEARRSIEARKETDVPQPKTAEQAANLRLRERLQATTPGEEIFIPPLQLIEFKGKEKQINVTIPKDLVEPVEGKANYFRRKESPDTLAQKAADPTETPAVGPLMPGSLDGLGAKPLDEAAGQAEMFANYARPLLDKVGELLGTGALKNNYAALSLEAQADLRRWVADARRALPEAKLAAVRIAESHRDLALLNYERRYNWDNGIGMAYPYHFWGGRSMVNWAMRAADRPAILSWFARLMLMQQENEEREEWLPSRLRGRLRVELPFLPDWAGDSIYVDPLGKLFPFREFLRPYEQMIQSGRAVDNKARDLLYRWVEDGTASETEAQTALAQKSGPLWEKALTEARSQEGEGVLDFMNLFTSPALYLSAPLLALQDQSEKIGPFPPSRYLQGLSAATGLDFTGIDLEAHAKSARKISEFGEWGDYSIDRALAFMAFEGVVDVDAAREAMITHSGPLFEQARARVQFETMLRSPGLPAVYAGRQLLQGEAGISDLMKAILFGMMPAGILPEGELKMRGLYGKYKDAWNEFNRGNRQAINDFYDEHPEYAARAALYAEPEERLSRFLENQVKDFFWSADPLTQKVLRDTLGETFNAFVNGDDDVIVDDRTLAGWGQALGARTAGVEGAPVTVELPPQSATSLYRQFLDARESEFPGYAKAIGYTYSLPEDQGKALRKKLPRIAEYYDWRNIWMAEHPEIIPYTIGEENELHGLPPETQQAVIEFRAAKAQMFPRMSEYWALPAKSAERREWLRANPEYKKFWDWQESYFAWHPEVEMIENPESVAQRRTQSAPLMSQISGVPGLMTAIQGATYGDRLADGAVDYMLLLWEKNGRPLGSFFRWMESLGLAVGR